MTSVVVLEEAVEISKPLEIGSGVLDIQAPVTVSAPIRLLEGGDLINNWSLTVANGGSLEVDGYYSGDGLLRTVDGGRVTAGDGGWMYISSVWLENAGDLTGSNVEIVQAQYLALDEETVFQDAAHVSSMEELDAAQNDRRVTAIVVDTGFVMDRGLMVGKPLLIEEGETLSCPPGPGNSLFMSGAPLVSHGRLEGSFQLDNSGTFLNFGSADIDIYATNSSYLLNFGEIALQHGQYITSFINNFGDMRLAPSSPYDCALELFGGLFSNFGTLTVSSGGLLQLSMEHDMRTYGRVVVEDGAWLDNYSILCVRHAGCVEVSGEVRIEGGVELSRLSALEMTGGTIEGPGIIFTWDDVGQLTDYPDVKCAVAGGWYTAPPSAYGADEASLREAVKTDQVVAVTGDVAVQGDLDVAGVLQIDSGSRLVVEGTLNARAVMLNGGELTVGGLSIREQGHLELSGGSILRLQGGNLDVYFAGMLSMGAEIDMGGGEIRMNNGLVLNAGTTYGCGGVYVTGPHSIFVNLEEFQLNEGALLHVNEGCFFSRRTLGISGGVEVDEAGYLGLSGANIQGGTLTNRGHIKIPSASANLSCESVLNEGGIELVGSAWQNIDLNCDVTNRGHLILTDAVNINGTLLNEGELELWYGIVEISGHVENRGEAYIRNDFYDSPDAGYRGSWSGPEMERRKPE